ncbi:MAG: hypothetical protein ACOYNS_11350 [Bacteroidota bacterium]
MAKKKMTEPSANDIIRRELEVAFSRHAQPIWFRITKWSVIMTAAVYFRKSEYFIQFILIFFLSGIMLHLLWRYKTKGWTQSWLGWNADINRPQNQTTNERQ